MRTWITQSEAERVAERAIPGRAAIQSRENGSGYIVELNGSRTVTVSGQVDEDGTVAVVVWGYNIKTDFVKHVPWR